MTGAGCSLSKKDESIADKLYKALSNPKHPEKTALIVKKDEYTYAQLKDSVFSFATCLQDNVVNRVALCTGRSHEMYRAIAGSIVSGTTYVPLNLLFPAKKSAFICEHSQSSHIFIAPECADYAVHMLMHCSVEYIINVSLIMTSAVKKAMTEALVKMVELGDLPELEDKQAAQNLFGGLILALGNAIVLADDDQSQHIEAGKFRYDLAKTRMNTSPIMHILYTSGTTGNPKGVAVSRANWTHYFNTITELYNYNESDVFSNFAEITFDISLQDPICAWIVGGTVVCATKRDMMSAVKFISLHNITVVHTTPAMISFIKKSGQFYLGALPSVRISIFIGEALWYKQAADFAVLCPNSVIYNTYGPTETTVAVTAYKIPAAELARHSSALAQDAAIHSSAAVQELATGSENGDEVKSIVPLGTPFRGVELMVVDAQGNEVGEGQQGELLIGGAQVTLGYLKNPEKNAEAFIKRTGVVFYRTGDVVVWSSDSAGNKIYHYVGRDDDMLKLHGHRVSYYEVDEQLGALTDHTVRSISYDIPEGGGRSNQLVVAVEGADEDECQRIFDEGRSNLAVYMHPTYVLPLAEFPLNVNGKVDRKAIKQQLMDKYKALSGQTDVR